MIVDQFMPDASPETARSGWLVVLVLPLLKVGGVPEARMVASELFELLADMVFDMVAYAVFTRAF